MVKTLCPNHFIFILQLIKSEDLDNLPHITIPLIFYFILF